MTQDMEYSMCAGILTERTEYRTKFTLEVFRKDFSWITCAVCGLV